MFHHCSSDPSAILNILNHQCRCIVTWHLLAANSKLVENVDPVSTRCSGDKVDFLSSQKALAAS